MSGLADLGAHGRPQRWWTPERVLLVIAGGMFVLAMIAKAPCAAGAWWDSPSDYADACHTDLVADYAGSGLAERIPPWDADGAQHVVREDQGVADAALSYVAAVTAQQITGAPDLEDRATTPIVDLREDETVRHEAVVFIGVSAAVQLLAFLSGVLLLARADRSRPYAMTVVAGAPVIVFTALLGWDMILFALVCGAWWAWSRRHAMLAGALIGAAGIMAFWPLLLLPGVALAAPRQGRLDEAGRVAGGAVIVWVCCAIGCVVVAGGALLDPIAAYLSAGPGNGSVWFVLAELGFSPDAQTLNVLVIGVMVIVLAAVAVFALRAYRTPQPATLAFLLVLGWFWATKSYEPQYAIALLPLAALAWPRWRDLLVWQAAEILFVLGTWWHLGGITFDTGDIDRVYPVLIVLRIGAGAWLAARIIVDHRYPVDVPGIDQVRPAGRT